MTETAFKNDSESNVYSLKLSSFAFKALFKAEGSHELFKKKTKTIINPSFSQTPSKSSTQNFFELFKRKSLVERMGSMH